MVDPLGFKPGPVADRRPVQAGAVKAPAPAAPAPAVEAAAKPVTGEVARTLSASAPVDSERVSRIKKAIEDGRFPLVPSTIADRLLALRLQWSPNDPA